MDEQEEWKNVNNEEGRKNYRRLKEWAEESPDKTKKEYFESICDEGK